MYRVLLVGGGTAGHVEPALAVGNWLLTKSEKRENITCEFIGTKSGIENELVPLAGLKLHRILKVPMPRKVQLATLFWPFRLGIAVAQAARIIRSADLVIGFGGYVSAPVYLAAKLARIPLIIHEANAIPGWANKLGARFAIETLTAFKSTSNSGGDWKSAKLVGMPIREEIFAIGAMSKSERSGIWDSTYRGLGLDRSKRTIFIFGGSLGAQSINKVIEQALPDLLKRDFNIIHGVGRGNELPEAAPGYFPLPYISNMAEMYIASDLIISRGGAVTCSEIEAANAFALIVPLPVGNGEQVANASELIEKGCATLCLNSDFSDSWLISNIDNLMTQAQDWNQKRTPISSKPAAEIIGEIILYHLESGN
jgi:UDP-N-acetylglucosamine--N-acetylmuramyl-(pentapeptide) pyrophosphoryl-undecaprenol N-acetylglucosamine transferase